MTPKRERLVLTVLLVTGVILPVAVAVLFLFARILAMLGDIGFGYVLDATAIVLVLLWIVDFVALVFAIAVNDISNDRE